MNLLDIVSGTLLSDSIIYEIMSTKERRKSVSAPEILRRDSKAFADKKVSLTDIQREREEGSDSSSVDLMMDLLSQHESPSSSQGSLDWLGDPLTPTSTQGPWRFETEFTDLTDEEDPEETLPSSFSASLSDLDCGSDGLDLMQVSDVEIEEENAVMVSHNVRRVTRSLTLPLLTRSVVNLEDIEDS
mgnify:CR=1 FL=1